MAEERRTFGAWLAILLFPAIFIPAGTAGLIFGVRQTRGSIASASWPRAQGTIIYAAQRSQSNQVRVVYEYAANGERYRADRHSFAFSYARPSHGDEAGDPVEVFYDPSDPANAVLNAGFKIGPLLFALFGAVLMAVGTGIGWLFLNEGRVRRRTIPRL